MKVQTGTGTIPLTVAAAILSLALVVNLPGLAVSPMLGELKSVFPSTTELEEQLLTLLPNLLVIPCVLLGGRLSVLKNRMVVITVALSIYAAAGIACFFARSMTQLIVISCALGAGAGLLIPFSTGLIADVFTGARRMRLMGLQSGISNMSLVAATLVVGWLGGGNWHLPFLVYLIPLIPLSLVPFLFRLPSSGAPVAAAAVKGNMDIRRLAALMGVYFFFTYAVIVISYYAPFVVRKEHLSTEFTGTITSLFFLFVFLPGFILPQILDLFGRWTVAACAFSVFAGLLVFVVFPERAGMIAAAILMGAGYGTVQPLLYDKAALTATDSSKSTLALSFLLASNYLAVVLAPVIVDFFRTVFDAGNVRAFSFILNSVLSGGFLLLVLLKRNSFVFSAGAKK